MIVELLLIIQHTAHKAESFDRAIPGCGNQCFTLGHVHQIDYRVIMSRKRFGLTPVYDIEKIDVVIPGTDLNSDRKYPKSLVIFQHDDTTQIELTYFEGFGAVALVDIEYLQKSILAYG